MNRNAPTDPVAPPGHSSRRLVLVVLAVLLLVGAGVGVKVWLGGSSDDKKDNPGPDRKRGPVTQRSACSDYDDPKEFEPLDFGKPIEVRFERRLLDALDPEKIPEVERYPEWQPKELVAVLGEHRMRGGLFALHPEGKTLAVAAWNDPYVRFGGLDTLHEKFLLGCPGGARVLEWSPDGNTLALSCGDGPIRLFDVRDLAKVPEPVVLPRAPRPITSLAFSADGKYLLGGDSTPKTGSAWVWDLKSPKIVKQLIHVGPVTSVAFSPVAGDYRALTGGGVQDNKLHLWDVLTGKETAIDFHLKEDETAYVGQVAFSRDGKRILSCHSDGVVRLWDPANFKKGKETALLRGHAGCPLAAFSPDGRHVASGRLRDNGVWLWNARDGKQVRRLATSLGVQALRFLPEGDRLVFTGAVSNDANVHVHEVATGKEVLPPVGHLGSVTCVALAPEGRVVASGANDLTARLWDLDGVKQRHALGASYISGIGFQPDGKRVFYWGASWAVLPFADVASGQNRTPAYKSQHSGPIHSAALTRDGRYAVTGGYSDGTVRMWRLADGLEVRQFAALGQGPHAVTVAPDMRRALSVGGGKTRLLQLRCRETVREWAPIAWAPFLSDGRAVFFGGAEALAWKITADKVEEAGRYKLNLAGLSQGQLSADSKRVAAILGGRVVMFELETGKELWTWTPPAHFYGVRGVALAPDGGHLLTANGDGTLYVIRLP